MLEENKIVLENDNQQEIASQLENQTVAEIQGASEFNTIPENANEIAAAQIKPKQKSKMQFVTGLSSSLVGVVAAALVGITSLLNVSMNAEFSPDTSYDDGMIKYVINVENMSEEETLLAYVYDGEELIDTLELKDDDQDGIIEGKYPIDKESLEKKLSEGDNVRVEYRMTLKADVGLNVERAFDSYVIQIDKFTSSIENVDMWCSCGEDGYYNFQIQYSDPLGKFTDFEAYIEDADGNIATCTFSENLHDAQRIFVNSLNGSKCKLVIKYKENGVETFVEFNNESEGGTAKDQFKWIKL